jgi:sec-independent protein translocase protein TatC
VKDRLAQACPANAAPRPAAFIAPGGRCDIIAGMAADSLTEQEMTIWDHIFELRSRLLKAMLAMVLTTMISLFYLGQFAIEFLALPAGGLDHFHSLEVTEGIGVYMRVSLLTGFVMALPFIVYHILAFVVPGLYDNEKRWVFLAIPTATLLFIGGAAFAYYIILYTALPFLEGFLEVQNTWSINRYVSFATNLLFYIGLAFETPLVVFMLAKFNIVNPGLLARQWRFAVVIIAIVAAVVTPTPDPITMGLTMAPLLAIYLLSILFAGLAQPVAKRGSDES